MDIPVEQRFHLLYARILKNTLIPDATNEAALFSLADNRVT
ncbi:hypothetical protein M989_00813 [Kluyvera georgiana ATCC 51603]|uniref:Uncharacterized protein n=1 Tax=Kluyvera georgiana ATCC 51603 TaxID=1354264 RepID=A0A1B7K6L1_9ENTR|nr:hypothetical protein M989_00813 [Kluyvera georgiana ATCC 51603]